MHFPETSQLLGYGQRKTCPSVLGALGEGLFVPGQEGDGGNVPTDISSVELVSVTREVLNLTEELCVLTQQNLAIRVHHSPVIQLG